MYSRPQVDESGDPRDRKATFDLYKVDYKWVESQTSKKELKGAYNELIRDGGYPDLLKAVENRLRVIDPKFRTSKDYNNYTAEDERVANEDVLAFLDEMNTADKKIRG